MLRNSFKILLAISLTLSSVACATGGPIVETCLMNGQKRQGNCRTRDAQDVVRAVEQMDKYVCTPADDFRVLLNSCKGVK
jgi:hypothetical protein